MTAQDSYNKEEAKVSANYDSVKTERLSEMEKMLESFHEENRTLLASLKNKDQSSGGEKLSSEEASGVLQPFRPFQISSIAALQGECDELRAQVDELNAECLRLHTAVGQGYYNPEKLRCITSVNNPADADFAIRTSRLQALRQENDVLLKKLKNQETSASDWVPAASLEDAKMEIERLENEQKVKDKRLLRLKDVSGLLSEMCYAQIQCRSFKPKLWNLPRLSMF